MTGAPEKSGQHVLGVAVRDTEGREGRADFGVTIYEQPACGFSDLRLNSVNGRISETLEGVLNRWLPAGVCGMDIGFQV